MPTQEQRRQPPPPSRLRLLRVLNVAVTAATYCARHAGRLIAIAWLPCLLESASRLGLEWLLFSYPPKMPDVLLSDEFNPPTWLTAFVPTPFAAMAWAFILSDMLDRNSKRGTIDAPALRWLRFELSPPVFAAAAIFSAANVVDGLIRSADRALLVWVASAYDNKVPDAFFEIWGNSAIVIRTALAALVMAWIFPLAGNVLRGRALNASGVWRSLRKNVLRLAAIFFLLTIALSALDRLLGPAKAWLVRQLTDPPSWTLKAATISYVLDFPVSMLWIILWAVTVGIVLDALMGAQPLGAQRPAAERRPRARL
jgi:hypothetical protein